MNLQQVKILIEKINSLYKSIDTAEGKLAPIERDLMLNYLRQLYELFLKADDRSPSSQDQSAAEPTNRPRPEPLRRTYKPPRIIEIPDAGQENPTTSSSAQEPTNAPAPEKKAPRSQPEPSTQEPTEQPPAPRTQPDRPEVDALFEQKRATELSEKLSESPVNDLTKAMAINDRLLYMNELFGKNMNTLDETLHQLNRYDNMEQAKPMLKDLAGRFHWTEEEKIDTAKSFIKLVRRRYAH